MDYGCSSLAVCVTDVDDLDSSWKSIPSMAATAFSNLNQSKEFTLIKLISLVRERKREREREGEREICLSNHKAGL